MLVTEMVLVKNRSTKLRLGRRLTSGYQQKLIKHEKRENALVELTRSELHTAFTSISKVPAPLSILSVVKLCNPSTMASTDFSLGQHSCQTHKCGRRLPCTRLQF